MSEARLPLVLGVTAAALALLLVRERRKTMRDRRFSRPMMVNHSEVQRRHAQHADTVDDGTDEGSGSDTPPPQKAQTRKKSFTGEALALLTGTETPWPKTEKEDSLLGLLFSLMRDRHLSLKDACEYAERMIYEHLEGVSSELLALAPDLVQPSHRANGARRLHSALPLGEAFRAYDAATRLSSRKLVPPQFREVRNIVNLAQIYASATAGVKLITLDGDGTLYPDRHGLAEDGAEDGEYNARGLIDALEQLLQAGVSVALVTAVGDPSPEPFEKRLMGLLKRLQEKGAARPVGQLYAVGGQCNYVFRYSPKKGGLEPMPREQWAPEAMREWEPDAIAKVLDGAQAALRIGARQLGIEEANVKIIRKERAVGLLYNGKVHKSTPYFLDELALQARKAVKRVQRAAPHPPLPFCTFNGGKDVFVDVGTKEIGIDVLRGLTGAERAQTLHMGDQFTRTGNDLLARRACGTVWVDDPGETLASLKLVLEAMEHRGAPRLSEVLRA